MATLLDQGSWLADLPAAESVARHPFLRRWFAGELTAGDLQAFAAEHYHAELALDHVARRAVVLADGELAEQLAAYADDQDERIDLWLRFAAATGWDGCAWYFGEDPLRETVACRRAWADPGHSLDEHLATIHTAESVLASLAPRQLGALIGSYGFGEPSTLYFRLRPDHWNGPVPPHGPAVVEQAERTCRAYLELLDGVATARRPSG